MADTVPPTDQDIGIFISPIVVGYSEPDVATIIRIQAAVQKMPSRQLLKDLIVIKLLAPSESNRLQICNVPDATAIITQLRRSLLQQYREEK